jgi:hypothetical protein
MTLLKLRESPALPEVVPVQVRVLKVPPNMEKPGPTSVSLPRGVCEPGS